MKLKFPPALALAAGAAGVILLFWAFHRDAVVEGPGVGPALAPGGIAGGRGMPWSAGSSERYEVAIESTVSFAPAGAEARPPAISRLAGRLHLRVFEFDGAFARVGLQLQPVVLSGEAAGEESAGSLSALFLATFEASGAIRELIFPPALAEPQRRRLEEVLRIFQVVVPEGSGPTWTVEEEHTLGRYTARYQRDGEGAITKVKTGYRPAGPEDLLGTRAEVRRSLGRIQLASGGSWCERIGIEDDVAIRFGQEIAFESSVRASLERVPPPQDPESSAVEGPRTFAEARASLLRPAEGRTPAEVAADRPRAGEAEFRALREIVAQIDADGGKSRNLVSKLERLLVEFPDLAERVADILLEPGLGDRASAEIILALEVAGTPQAQAALVEVLEDAGRKHQDRVRAAIALGGVLKPSEGSLDGLWRRFADRVDGGAIDISNTAALALGTQAAHLRADEPPRYENLRSQLLDRLHRSVAADETSILLIALGNAGDASLADEVGGFLSSENISVRSAASRALGALPDPRTVDLLSSRLPEEPEAKVRSAIAESLVRLSIPEEKSLAAVRRCVGVEPDPGARFFMARYLAENLDAYPEGREALERIRSTETSERIRLLLAEKLPPGR